MAKKDKATIFNEFLADLKAINPGIEELVKDDKVVAKLKESVLARADYSQSMDELKAQQDAFAEEVRQAREKIQGWQTWYGDATSKFTQTEDELKKYKDEFGELSEGDRRREAAKVGLTPEEVDKRLNDEIGKREAAYLKFADDLTDIKIEHRQRFNEKLDTAEVYKIAGEQQISLDIAYKTYIADRVEELNKTKYAEDIAKAKEEGAREALSKHNLPFVNSNPDVVHVLDAQGAHAKSSDRISAAVAAFNGRK